MADDYIKLSVGFELTTKAAIPTPRKTKVRTNGRIGSDLVLINFSASSDFSSDSSEIIITLAHWES